MATSIGVNLRVTGHSNQGGRKYMEDVYSVAYQQTADEKDLEYAFFGIFDGHGGREAAIFAKEHLMDFITKQKNFWSEDDDLVLKAIREGFLATQQAMLKDQVNWRPTASGLPSTAGTTASICFIKRGKMFVGHCGDSGIVLGEEDPRYPGRWRARTLTTDHKPESEAELERIKQSGGKVINKSGVPRVVWYRPRMDHQGPVRRSTTIDEVPFLAVARALGDLWSYNPKDDVFVVSPEPDLHVYKLDVCKDRCLILATDGAWNVLSPDMAVQCVYDAEKNNEKHMINSCRGDSNEKTVWVNPSKKLVDLAIDRWNMCRLRADNTSIVTVMLDPPGPPRAQVLRRVHGLPSEQSGKSEVKSSSKTNSERDKPPPLPPKSKGISIISRFPNSSNDVEKNGTNLMEDADSQAGEPSTFSRIVHDSMKSAPQRLMISNQTLLKPIETKLKPTKSHSPTPPPLPERPANLKKFNNNAKTHHESQQQQKQPPRPPKAQKYQNCVPADKPVISSPVRSQTLPIAPVKQPKRSLVPEYYSDVENQPEIKSKAAQNSCSRLQKMTRRSLTCKTTSGSHSAASRQSGTRRSEPYGMTRGSRAIESPARVLRPRNKIASSESPSASASPGARVTRSVASPSMHLRQGSQRVSRRSTSSSVLKTNSNNCSTHHINMGLKRKRRSLDTQMPAKQMRGYSKHGRSS